MNSQVPHTHGGTDASECTPFGTRCAPTQAPQADETLTEFVRDHRRNEVQEPGPILPDERHWPGRTRVKCDSNRCNFYAVGRTWFQAVELHEAHVAEALATHVRTIRAEREDGEAEPLFLLLRLLLTDEYGDEATGSLSRIVYALGRRDATIRADAEQAAERWRKAIASIGYGDNKTEPQISPEEFVREFERINADAAEWRESQQWRIECRLAGHPEDEDCAEHDPTLRAEQAAARALVEAADAVELACSHFLAFYAGTRGMCGYCEQAADLIRERAGRLS